MDKYYQKGVYPAPYKLIVLGDVHGDWYATINSLKKGKIVDDKLNWIAGKTHVVQMGDILDRGGRGSMSYNDEDSEFKIMTLFLKLMKQSFEKGGGFHCIIGNHELMNIMGDFRFTSRKGIHHFKQRRRGRRIFFRAGSDMCKVFAKYWNPIIKIGKYVFCHGGLSGYIARKYSIPTINSCMRAYLRGNVNLVRKNTFRILFVNSESLLWNRKYSAEHFNAGKVKDYLRNIKCQYMVVGHTPQTKGINLRGGVIWCVDTGMSEAFGKRNNKRLQLLSIINNGKKVSIIR